MSSHCPFRGGSFHLGQQGVFGHEAGKEDEMEPVFDPDSIDGLKGEANKDRLLKGYEDPVRPVKPLR